MKAIVVDIKDKYAVVLNRQGRFIKIRNNNLLRVGYEVDLPQSSIAGFSLPAKAASIAAVLLLTLGLGYGAYSYSMPYSYVDVDINPSIEITANMYERIINVEGLNEDGRKLLSEGSYKNMKLKDGVKSILDSAVKKGYLKTDSSNEVMLTVSGKDQGKVEEIEKKLEGVASKELKAAGVETAVTVKKVTLEKREAAKKIGISPGKLNLIEKLIEVRPELKAEDLKEVPVKEIMKSIKQSRKEAESKDKTAMNNGAQKPGKPERGEKTGKEEEKDKSEKREVWERLQGSKGNKPGRVQNPAGKDQDDDEDKKGIFKKGKDGSLGKLDKDDKENKAAGSSKKKPEEDSKSKWDKAKGKSGENKDKNENKDKDKVKNNNKGKK